MSPDPPLVFVVDDDPSVGRSLGRLLRSMGLRSREFASGPELLADERRGEAACILVDIHMPRMNGYDLAGRLADTRTAPPIIFITAKAEEEDRWQNKRSPAVALLVKPFSEKQLLAALEKALGRDLTPASPA